MTHSPLVKIFVEPSPHLVSVAETVVEGGYTSQSISVCCEVFEVAFPESEDWPKTSFRFLIGDFDHPAPKGPTMKEKT